MARPRTVGRKTGVGIRVKFNLKRECGDSYDRYRSFLGCYARVLS